MAPKSTLSPAPHEETPSNVSPLRKTKPPREEAWSPSNPNFSPDVYYVRATDPSGLVGHVIPVKFPPEIANYLATVVQSGKNPYFKTNADLIRHAVVTYLATTDSAAEDPKLQALLRDTTAAQRTQDLASQAERFKSLLADMQRAFDSTTEIQAYDDFREYLFEMEELVNAYDGRLYDQLHAKIAEYRAKLPPLASNYL